MILEQQAPQCMGSSQRQTGISVSYRKALFWYWYLVSVSVSVSIGGFSESRYQSRYRLGAFLSPGISPGIDWGVSWVFWGEIFKIWLIFMENWKPYVVKVSISVSVSIEDLVSVSVSVSTGGFFEYRYQSRYRLGALLSPGISPGIDSEAAKVSVSVSVPKSWYRLSLADMSKTQFVVGTAQMAQMAQKMAPSYRFTE